ncbi:MAG: leucyl aminopeptidase [Pseudomonadales bacterium]|nr:leucyl aminopeptidase [Pseudomonadales bacterium]MDG2079393.1 leucyl aminopeptidase [Pseudomonadales bacterium]
MRAFLKNPGSITEFSADLLIVPIFADKKLSKASRDTDRALKKQISRLLDAGDFNGKKGETLLLPGVQNLSAKHVMLWGCGDKAYLQRQHWVTACHLLSRTLNTTKAKHIAIAADFKMPKTVPNSWALQQISTQLTRGNYRYTTTKKSAAKGLCPIEKISFLGASDTANSKHAIAQGIAIGDGINIARDLGDLPGNICTPKYLSSEARKLGRKFERISTKVLGEKQMGEMGMGSLLSVGHGSKEESQFIIMEYKGGKKSAQPHVLVGKGITFDTGGISLKPGAKMDEMKFDMCGAASVLGTMHALATMNLPINVIGVIAAAENMPAGNATKPGDVVTSMAGKTIEVLNTDAEGRLVLCDALHYVKRFKPASVVDMATLTGACIVALGHHASGLLSNDDSLAEELLAAGIASGDRAWRLPIWDEYQEQLKTPYADLANIGAGGAGTITAACFLSQFAEDYRWAHLDIAGTAWNQPGPKGASGRPVALLCQYLQTIGS